MSDCVNSSVKLLILLCSINSNYFGQIISGTDEQSLLICADGNVLSMGSGFWGAGMSANVPTQFPGLDSVVKLDGGYLHGMAISADKMMWTWGYNSKGQLGVDYVGSTSSTGPILNQDIDSVVDVAAGQYHSLAVDESGNVYSFGDKVDGQLGIVPYPANEKVPNICLSGGFIKVAAGQDHSLALNADGTVWAWGKNQYGQLGLGYVNSTSNIATWTPNQIPTLTDVIDIQSGYNHCLALKSDGTVWAWGYNNWGQLGDGSSVSNSVPVQLSISSGVIQIGCLDNSSIALKNDGSVWTWGGTAYGQLGNGVVSLTGKVLIPTQIVIDSVTYVGTGSSHCFAVRSDSTVWCWGKNQDGQLGLGHTSATLVPTLLSVPCSVLNNTPSESSHRIKGKVFSDFNGDCLLNIGDDEVSHFFPIRLQPSGELSFVNNLGEYIFEVEEDISYSVSPIIANSIKPYIIDSCISSYDVEFSNTDPVDSNGFDFGYEFNDCPILKVDFTSHRKRRCMQNLNSITFWNNGFVDATDVKIHASIPKYVNIISTDSAYTINAGDSTIVFDIGTLHKGETGIIRLIDSVSCEQGISGLSQCVGVWITSSNLCTPNYSSLWDGSEIEVDGECMGDSVVSFTIKNAVSSLPGDMLDSLEYRIFADNELAHTGKFQLTLGDTKEINIEADGRLMRLEADQSIFYPYQSYPRKSIEFCNSLNSSESQIDNSFQDDYELSISYDCPIITDSYDPNDKAVSPKGITSLNYVKPNEFLEYKLRFQNTGNDTAFNVVLIDTLSSSLDLNYLELGGSSYPYTVELSGSQNPILKFVFTDINLPDSATNELGSQGFVKFKVRLKDSISNGTIVSNNADIYFDFNLPVRTNDAWVTVFDTVINTTAPVVIIENTSSLESVLIEGVEIFPNPVDHLLFVDVSKTQQGVQYSINVYSVLGELLKSKNAIGGSQKVLDFVDYHSGIYFVEITDETKSRSIFKIIKN